MKTLDYYKENAELFVQGTVNVDFSDTQGRFLRYLEEGAYILDFGCGSGRDSKYFISKGYLVDATDGSQEMVDYSSKYTGLQVRKMMFNELDENDKYDGIWACASILHLPKEEITNVIIKMEKALKSHGVMYLSFKYGNFEGERNGRWFTDFVETSFQQFIMFSDMSMLDMWITRDVREGRSDERWLNAIMQKP